MSDQPKRRPTFTRPGLRRLPLSLLVALAAAMAATLLAPEAARADECMSPPAVSANGGPAAGGGDRLDCGGGGEQPGPQPPQPPPPPPSPGSGSGGSCSGAVVLYEHADYEGECWSFAAGQTVYVGDGANDRASSIRVAEGYVATLYEHDYFGGGSINTFTAGDPWGWASVGNDAVSSLVVQASEPDWSSYFYGNDETAEPTAWDLTQMPASGCSRVGASVARRGLRGRQWEFGLITSYCWNGSSISSIWSREVVALIDPIPFPFNLIQGWRYSPVGFQPGEPGYPSSVLRADGRFEFCGFKYGCVASYQPWVRIELRANGAALCSTSFRTSPFACKRY